MYVWMNEWVGDLRSLPFYYRNTPLGIESHSIICKDLLKELSSLSTTYIHDLQVPPCMSLSRRRSRACFWPQGATAECSFAQSCPVLCDPMDYSPTASSVHGVFWQEYWSGLPFPLPGVLPDPGIELVSPALAGGFFTTWKPQGVRHACFLQCT